MSEKRTPTDAAAEKISVARQLILKCWPYLFPAVLRMPIRWTDATPTIAVDRYWRVYANPDWVEQTPVSELALIWAGHETQHVLHQHFRRFEGADPQLANLAGDLSINSDLPEYCRSAEATQRQRNSQNVVEFSVPESGVYPHMFRTADGTVFPSGLLAEEYYALLQQLPNPPDHSSCQCGSGATGTPLPFEEGGGAPETESGDDTPGREFDGVSDSEAATVILAVASEVVQHESRYPGSTPKGLRRRAEEILAPPRVPWRTKLRRAVRATFQQARGAFDYSYRCRNRRDAGPVLLPGTVDYRPSTFVIVDTSGSMSQVCSGSAGPQPPLSHYRAALIELAGIAAAVGESIWVAGCDTVLGDPQRVRRPSDVNRLSLSGGGGTALGRGIAEVLTRKPRPGLIVVLTDGITEYDCPPPSGSTRVLIAITSPAESVRSEFPTPPWAEVVYLDDYASE